jgi:hypothetical protein
MLCRIQHVGAIETEHTTSCNSYRIVDNRHTRWSMHYWNEVPVPVRLLSLSHPIYPVRAPVLRSGNPSNFTPVRQPLIKRALQHITSFHIGETDPHLRQPQDEQDYQQNDYGYCQQVAEREPWTTIATHTLSFRR